MSAKEEAGERPVDDILALRAMEETARRLGVAVRYERLDDEDVKMSSGFCRVNDEKIVIIDKRLDTKGRWKALAMALKQADINSIFLPPLARKLLDME
ncbi:MAG: hypothetical protein HQK86_04940 [Nitrospinae bacterium]|nr:hypothetical protein [Nitrospinota bacterium]MBF0633168.1 hypothetical protein [Nitrospinota bacterium]